MNSNYKTRPSIKVGSFFLDVTTGELLSPIETQNYFIIQTMDNFMKSSFSFQEHEQFCDIELTYAYYNNVSCSTNGQFLQLFKNDCYLSLRGDKHELKSNTATRFLTLAFNIKNDSPYYYLLEKIKEKFSAIEKRLFKSLYLDFDIFEILNDVHLKNPDFTVLCDACITRLLIKLDRYNTNKELPETLVHPEEFLPDVSNFIDDNFLTLTSLLQVSDYFGFSYNYLCKIFKEQYGYGMQDYLISKKMNYAKMLLKENKSLTEISEILNYTSPYNFSRAFKKYFGFSPSNIKNSN